MIVVPNTQDTDRILDELELLAKSNSSNEVFWEQLLSSLKELLSADATAIVIRVHDKWLLLSHLGKDIESRVNRWTTMTRSVPNGEVCPFLDASPSWIGIPTTVDSSYQGYLFVEFSDTIPVSTRPTVTAIGRAFIEIFELRQSLQGNPLIQVLWREAMDCIRQVQQDNSTAQVLQTLVSRLMSITAASRVSVVYVGPGLRMGPRLQATSSVTVLAKRTPAEKALVDLAMQTAKQRKALISKTSDASDGYPPKSSEEKPLVFANHICIPWSLRSIESGSAPKPDYVLVLEWKSLQQMSTASTALPFVLEIFEPVCLQRIYWLSLPRWFRLIAKPVNSGKQYLRAILWLGKPLILLALLSGLFYAATRPYPMVVEADATLEPAIQRSVHANLEGFVEELYVEDGDTVTLGQSLAKLRSPNLEMQIEEALGAIRSLAEKRNGLRVALNQLPSNSSESIISQTRLSAEIRLLDVQEKHAKEKLDFLHQERNNLVVVAPINGVVISRELRRDLESKPVKRGDTLVRLADLAGEWRLKIRLADRDTQWVKRFYQSSGDPQAELIRFNFDSLPDQSYDAMVESFANFIEVDPELGGYQEVLATLDKAIAAKAHFGAKARVRFQCGTQAAWYVWSRPLYEYLQKRLGYYLFAGK